MPPANKKQARKPWFETLGYATSPFSVKNANGKGLIGTELDLQRCLELIDKGKLIVVQGEYGTGKTTFVHELLDCLEQDGLYFSANRLVTYLDVKKLLKSKTAFLPKLFGSMPKNIVCVFDEAHHLKEKDFKELYTAYTSGHMKSVVFVTSDMKRLQLTKKLEKAINGYVIPLGYLTKGQAEILVEERVEKGIPGFDKKTIGYVHDVSGGKARSFLHLCDKVARFLVDNERKRITKKDIVALAKK